MAIMVLHTCQQIDGGLPANVQSKMYFNIALDFGIGLVPFLGDIADAVFRANTRNAVELERHLRAKGAKALKARGHAAPHVDPSDPDVYDRQVREELGPPPQYTSSDASRQPARNEVGHTAPLTEERPRGGGWFSGFGSKKQPQHDVERGEPRRRDEAPPIVPVEPPRPTKSKPQKGRR
jgi:hypothetical protein